jgi:hypothetical protein
MFREELQHPENHPSAVRNELAKFGQVAFYLFSFLQAISIMCWNDYCTCMFHISFLYCIPFFITGYAFSIQGNLIKSIGFIVIAAAFTYFLYYMGCSIPCEFCYHDHE